MQRLSSLVRVASLTNIFFALSFIFAATFVAPSPASATGVDHIDVVSGLIIDVYFNGPMSADVLNTQRYTISGAGQGTLGARPDAVTDMGANRYRLTWDSGEMVNGGSLSVKASAKDAANKNLSPDTKSDVGLGVPPTVALISVQTARTVNITFSEPMGTSAATAANYTISGGGIGSLAAKPFSVAIVSGNTYRLTWNAGEMLTGGDITITVSSNAKDTAGNGVGIPNNATHTDGGIGIPPSVSSVNVAGTRSIDVVFSEAMGANVTTAANYTLSGTGKGTIPAVPSTAALVSGNTYRLTFPSGEMKIGGDLTITVSNDVKDVLGNALGTPDSATDIAGGIGTRPAVISMSIINGTTINITFRESMGLATLLESNYVLSGTGKGTLTSNPDEVNYTGSGNVYQLTWTSGEMKIGGNITVTAAGAEDLAGNTPSAAENSGSVNGGGIGVRPTVTAVSVVSLTEIDVTYSEEVNTGSRATTNYALSGTGKGTFAATPNSATQIADDTIRLTWSSGEMLQGGDITIAVVNVQDLATNAIATPNSTTHTGGGMGTAPSVTAVAVIDSSSVNVTFSEAMGTGVPTAANYVLSGSGQGTLSIAPSSVAYTGNNNTYKLTWASGEMKQGGDITVTVSNAQDLAGNAIGTPNSRTHTGGAIGVLPTVKSVTVINASTVEVIFSEPVSNGATAAANYALSGSGAGTLAAIPDSVAQIAPDQYHLTWASGDMQIGGDITITVSASVQDLVGNALGMPNNGTHPGGAIAIPPGIDAVNVFDTLSIDVTFDKPMSSGVTTAANYTLSGDGKGTLAENPDSVAHLSGTTYRLAWTSGEMMIGGDIIITAANVYDLAGNLIGAVDNAMHPSGGKGIAPTCLLSPDYLNPTNVSPIPVTVTFNESVTGFAADDVIAANATIANFRAISATQYKLDLVPLSDGQISASIPASRAQDLAGNANLASAQLTHNYDGTAPTISFTSSIPPHTNSNSIPVTLILSEPVTDLDELDITLGNSTLNSYQIVSPTEYRFNLILSADGLATAAIGADVIHDAAGNGNTAASFSRTYDSTRPGVTLGASVPNPTNSSAIQCTATFTEAVSEFSASDITVTNATIRDFTALSASTYQFELEPTAQGTITAMIPQNIAEDSAGNKNTASAVWSRIYDSAGPQPIFETAAPDPTNTSPISLTIRFAEDVTLADSSKYQVENATHGSFQQISSREFQVTLTPSSQGSIRLSILSGAFVDAAGNPNVEASFTRIYDSLSPEVSITSAAPDPTNQHIPVEVTFTEPVVNFIEGDLIIEKASVQNFASVSSTKWTLTLVPTGTGLISINMAAGAVDDTAGNPNTASNVLTRNYDNASPTVWMTSSVPPITNQTPIPVVANFSKPVIGFSASDIAPINATVVDFAVISPTEYSFSLTPLGQGEVKVDIAAGVAADALGNPNLAASTFSRFYDSIRPTIQMTSPVADPTNLSPIPVTISLSEAADEISQGSIQVTNGSIQNLQKTSETEYLFNLVPSAQGLVTAKLPAKTIQDAAGNSNAASAQISRAFDSISPAGAISSTAANPTSVTLIPARITFTEAIIGFTAENIETQNASVQDLQLNGTSAYTFNIKPMAQGQVTARVPAGAAHDAAGNPNIETGILSRNFDSVRPTVTISSLASNPTSARIRLNILFSEPVSRFSIEDVKPTNSALQGFNALSPTSYTLELVPIAEGLVTAAIAEGAAFDAAGNPNMASNLFSRVYDRVAPQIANISANPRFCKPGASGSLSVEMTETPAANPTVKINGVPAQIASHNGGAFLYRFTIPPSSTDGWANAEVTSKDQTGNISTTTTLTALGIDGTRPRSSVSAMNGLTTDPTVTLSWKSWDTSSSDCMANIESVSLYWHKGLGGYQLVGFYPAGTTSATFDAASHGGTGTYGFYTVAKDKAGNVEAKMYRDDRAITVNLNGRPLAVGDEWSLYR